MFVKEPARVWFRSFYPPEDRNPMVFCEDEPPPKIRENTDFRLVQFVDVEKNDLAIYLHAPRSRHTYVGTCSFAKE